MNLHVDVVKMIQVFFNIQVTILNGMGATGYIVNKVSYTSMYPLVHSHFHLSIANMATIHWS